MAQAHRLGFRSTATMMFGHIESDADLIDHLDRLRRLQDRTGGFHSFIPWSFKPGGSQLSSMVAQAAHPARYVRIIAVARIFLDGFEHIQSSWFSESVTAGQLGLLAGADDFGGLLVEENVLRETGYRRATCLQSVLQMIRSTGFTPARRSSDYEIIERF
jgi:cyclic dehypoxanthinyl futalosine synthase